MSKEKVEEAEKLKKQLLEEIKKANEINKDEDSK